jgi:DNA-binding LacI/PurR family transcriptional regulator
MNLHKFHKSFLRIAALLSLENFPLPFSCLSLDFESRIDIISDMKTPTAERRNFLKKRHSPLTIGFTAIADFSSFIGQEYLAGIMKACENYGVNFINITSAIRPSLFIDKSFFRQYLAKVQFMHAPLLDGLITWASSLSGYMNNVEIKNLFTSLSPLPMVDIGYLDIPKVPSIRIDNDYSIHLLVEHLAKTHGFKKIAFFGSKFSLPHLLRLESYKKAMSDFGLCVSDDMIFLADSLDEQDIAQQVKTFLTSFGITNSALGTSGDLAILTSSDIIAHTVIEELEKKGIRVPEDVAVTGFNNQFAGLTSSSPITTIDLAYFKRGYEAVELLIDRILSSEIPSQKQNDPPSSEKNWHTRCPPPLS